MEDKILRIIESLSKSELSRMKPLIEIKVQKKKYGERGGIIFVQNPDNIDGGISDVLKKYVKNIKNKLDKYNARLWSEVTFSNFLDELYPLSDDGNIEDSMGTDDILRILSTGRQVKLYTSIYTLSEAFDKVLDKAYENSKVIKRGK